MSTFPCSDCGEPLPLTARYCPTCGTSMPSYDTVAATSNTPPPALPVASVEDRPKAFKIPRFFALTAMLAPGEYEESTVILPLIRNVRNALDDVSLLKRYAKAQPDSTPAGNGNGAQQENGQRKIVEGNLYPPKTDASRTWYREFQPAPDRAPIAVAPRPTSSTPPRLHPVPAPKRKPLQLKRSVVFLWLTIFTAFLLLTGSIFGVLETFGHSEGDASNASFALSVAPGNVVIGAIVNLRGTQFTPHGRIGLTRDNFIPVKDTSGNTIIEADAEGKFSDTMLISDDWGTGAHTLSAEDATKHKVASFPIMVTGRGISLRPAHLNISTNKLDLGDGDQVTNSTRTITLSNSGAGQISWTSNTTQSWLQVSPKSGTFARGLDTRVTIAINRSNLKPGPYNGQVLISSNAGIATVAVTMRVTALNIGREAVLDLSPATLSFTAVDGSKAPSLQKLTIDNPGVLPLNWQASSSESWLTLASKSGIVEAGGSEEVAVSVTTANLLPGTYSAKLTFNANAPAKGTPQDLYVSVTVSPPCSLQLSPSMLTFTGSYLGTVPGNKEISIGNSQGCAALAWSAKSKAGWLTLSKASGSTPTTLAVGIAPSGLLPGVYHSSIVFTVGNSTCEFPVTFTLAQQATPVPNVNSSIIVLNSIAGQGTPATQTVSLSNSGGGSFSWKASPTTTVGGSWLTVSPKSGTLGAQQSQVLTLSATPLASLIPGSYDGTITVNATNSEGLAIAGSPLLIPVKFVIKAPCSFSTSATAINLTGVANQAGLVSQAVKLGAAGACANALDWTAETKSGGSWLKVTPASGSVTVVTGASMTIGAALSAVAVGTYSATVTVTAVDHVTKRVVQSAQSITVTVNVQAPCTLSSPTPSSLSFTSGPGGSPAVQGFTVSISGACGGNVTVTPADGANWLNFSPASWTGMTGGTATFSVTAQPGTLNAGKYNATITVNAVRGSNPLTGNSQKVAAILTVSRPPALAVTPASQAITVDTGQVSRTLTISNDGETPLNWTAALASNAPSFVSLSATSGTKLVGGGSASINLVVNATGLAGGGSYTTSVIIQAVDPATNKATSGSPVTIPVTITISPPEMTVSTTSLSFDAQVGGSAASKSVTVTNAGGDGLTWQVGTPSAAWLKVSPGSGSNAAHASSTLTFTVDPSGFSSAGTYSATVVVTPSVGQPVTISVSLNITAPTPTPTPMTEPVTPTPVPTAAPTPMTEPVMPTPTIVVAPASPTTTTAQVTPVPTPTPTLTTPASTTTPAAP